MIHHTPSRDVTDDLANKFQLMPCELRISVLCLYEERFDTDFEGGDVAKADLEMLNAMP